GTRGGKVMVSSRLVLAWVISGATVILATAAVARVDAGAAAQAGQGLEGSWLSGAAAATGGSFPLGGLRLSPYKADGTFVRTGLGRGVIPTTAHGTWIRTGDREFATTSVGFARDPDGNYTRTVKGSSRIQVNERGDETSTRFETEVFDMSGNVVARDSE